MFGFLYGMGVSYLMFNPKGRNLVKKVANSANQAVAEAIKDIKEEIVPDVPKELEQTSKEG